MPGNDPSRIYRDPALTDRRGDATGPTALLFLVLLVAGFAAVAVGLVSLPALVADPTPGPGTPAPVRATPTPTPAPSADPVASPGASPGPSTAPRASVGPAPSQAPPATAVPRASAGPLPSRRPQVTDAGRPQATGAGRPQPDGIIGEVIPVFIDGKRVGGVSVRSFRVGNLQGVSLPTGAKVVVVALRYATANGMAYDAADWVLLDTAGDRHASLGDQAPGTPLGSGTLAAGGSVTGNVAFIREQGVTIDQIVLTDGHGHDLVRVDRNSAVPSLAP